MERNEPILPYVFDETWRGKTILKGALGWALYMISSPLYKMAFSEQAWTTESMFNLLSALVLAGIIFGVGLLFFRQIGGASGVITENDIVITPGKIFGFCSNQTGGKFTIEQFHAIQIEVVSPSPMSKPTSRPVFHNYDRLSLIGKNDVPNIIFALCKSPNGIQIAKNLSNALKLPISERRSPY